MRLGLIVRNMGDLATAGIVRNVAIEAEQAGLDGVWVTDHIAIPPDEAEGSNGRYLDPLTTLSFLAAATHRIALGTSVLILPYRRALPTAKSVATVQELSGGRLRLGVGVGWMRAEFKALGIERRRRGRDTDRVLDTLNRCFAGDEVEENGQTFLFRPRPARPPIFVGGSGSHALQRTVKFADGWLPGRISPSDLSAPMAELAELADRAGRPMPSVVMMLGLPLGDGAAADDLIAQYDEAGVCELIHAGRFSSESDCLEGIAALHALKA